MDDIQALIRSVNFELSPLFEERLRALLADKEREWLVDQVVRLSLDAHSLREIDRRSERDAKAKARAARLERVRTLRLDADAVAEFVAGHASTTRDSLLASGHLLPAAPPKGTSLLTAEHRSPAGEHLLEHAKDVLFALLFGDVSTLTTLERVQQELLTFALPVSKASALDFMRASTEITAAGTWQDPESVSNDERAANTLLEVQYGDTADELVGNGVITALGLINNLEVNEQVLYARMIDLEQTTLIS
ncbi:MAG TPA: hypothetical protein VNS80_09310 [Pseudolysinimonas sp.]|nr:hypothetical protein [Pseudolysinimonas sp.]